MTEEQLKDLEELRQFHADIEEYERNNPIDPRREAAEDAENRRMDGQFPGEFIAYLDTWDGATLTRTILAHAPDQGELSRALAHLSPPELEAVSVGYAYPNAAICSHALTGEINTSVPTQG